MAVLEGPLRQRQAELEVHRSTPLSLSLYQSGADPILDTVSLALAALSSAHSAAACRYIHRRTGEARLIDAEAMDTEDVCYTAHCDNGM